MIWIRNLHWGYILINEVGQWFYQLDHVTFPKNVAIPVCKLYIVLLLNLLRPNVSFIAHVKIDISSKKLHSWKCFKEKSRDRIHDVICRPHLSNFFDVVLFLLSSLVTDPSFMSISSLVLELWQFSFIRNWPEIRKSEIPTSEFCPVSADWGAS